MAPHTAAPGLVGRSWPKLKRTALGSQPPAKNLLRLSQLYFANLKNRTGIGSHLGAGKDQAFQANKPAMSGGLIFGKDAEALMVAPSCSQPTTSPVLLRTQIRSARLSPLISAIAPR